MIETAKSFGIDISNLTARQFSKEDFNRFDKIFIMDDKNYRNIVALAENESHIKKVYYTLSKQNNVPDPYFGGKDGFIQVYEMLKEACQTINDEIQKGKLILIPCTLGETRLNKVLPQENTTYINTCSEFIVENIRSARRFLIKSNINTAIDDLNFHLLNKHTKKYELSFMLKSIYDGKNIGLLSEAGCLELQIQVQKL